MGKAALQQLHLQQQVLHQLGSQGQTVVLVAMMRSHMAHKQHHISMMVLRSVCTCLWKPSGA